MRKLFFLTMCLFCAVVVLHAQKSSATYSGSLSVGLLIGESNNNIQLQAINGVRYKTWSAGVGVGLDDYYTRSIPLFLQVKKAIVAKPDAPFVYADAGYNFPYLKEVEKVFTEKATGGFYGEGGIGYDMRLLKKHGLFFGAGWRVKSFSQRVNTMPYISIWPLPESAFRTYEYTVSSLAIKVGFRF